MSKPMYYAYAVRNYTVGREKKAAWRRIGAVFPHSKGDGFDIVLDALPIDGRIVCREPLKDDELASEGEVLPAE